MLGRLSGNPNVLDHFFRGNRFEATYDLWTRGRPLKLPILNDHVRRQPSEVYPKSAHVRVCCFQFILSLYMLVVIYVDFKLNIRSCHACPINKHLTVYKLRKLNCGI